MIRFLLVLASILVVCRPQMIQQCTCAQMEPCFHADADTFFKCGDQCQRHAVALHFDYNAARQCFEQIRGPMQTAIECYKKIQQGTCATGAPQMVQKRYMETLKLALYNRINSMLDKSGVRDDVMEFVKSSQKFSGCQTKCVGKIAGYDCKSKNSCGLAEPPDNVIVEDLIRCAIQSGVNTQSIRSLCHCVAQAGNQQLEHICDKLVIE